MTERPSKTAKTLTHRGRGREQEQRAQRPVHRLLLELERTHRDRGTVHLVLDNYIIHKSRKRRRTLAKLDGKALVYFLPSCCPEAKPIERVWLDLHTAVSRKHKHETIEDLVVAVNTWLRLYTGQGSRYANTALAA